jgi:hypothetical protein
MKYAMHEAALNQLAGGSPEKDPFYGMAGALENILKDESTTPDEKAEKLAELIEAQIESGLQKPAFLLDQ